MALSHLLRSAITTLVPHSQGLARSRVCYENLARTGLCPDSVATTSVQLRLEERCELWRLVEQARAAGDLRLARSRAPPQLLP